MATPAISNDWCQEVSTVISPSLIERHLMRRPREPRLTGQERRAAALASHEPVVLRRAVTGDALTIARLQQLDDRTLPAGDRVVAQVGGEVIAAAHIPSGVSVADPFVPSGRIAELLSRHARTLEPQPLT
jgi:hypothetical protein